MVLTKIITGFLKCEFTVYITGTQVFKFSFVFINTF